ncbi:MAG: hypothetical protein IJI21_08870 [Clostridia bacterium]|nr:hypothetical protein [Clostridia bacterium]
MVNLIQRNAIAFQKLLHTEYYYCLSLAGKGIEVRLRFQEEDFHHLEGIGQLTDLQIHSLGGRKTLSMALNGEITEEDLKKSALFESTRTQNKIDCLYLLETALDHNDLVFRYVIGADGRIKIEASILLYTDVDGNQIYVYIDQEEGRNSDYYCRSFVANPSFDRKRGLKKMTLLWKEKTDLLTNARTLQYSKEGFTPAQLRT